MSWRDEINGILAPRPAAAGPSPRRAKSLREDSSGQSEPEIIVALRRIVADKTAEKITGVLVDMFSASAALQVYDNLSAANQKKMGSLPIRKMMAIVLKMLARKTG